MKRQITIFFLSKKHNHKIIDQKEERPTRRSAAAATAGARAQSRTSSWTALREARRGGRRGRGSAWVHRCTGAAAAVRGHGSGGARQGRAGVGRKGGEEKEESEGEMRCVT